MSDKINYVEFAAKDLAATKHFFETVFAWKFADYGEAYAAFYAKEAGLDGGFHQADMKSDASQGGALIVFYAKALEETQAKVEAAGGEISTPIFEFPGGRRFHFIEPSGNEFAVWSE